MARDHTFEALVLRRFPVGESHRSVTFLTREKGLLSAIAHGAAKSQNRLKLLTTPLRHVILKAYHDPVADSWKVTDLEGINLYGGLGETLDRSAAATLWTELLLGAWESGGMFDLFIEALSLLDSADAESVSNLDAQVLWRSLDLAGLMPDFSRCSACGKPLAGQAVWFSQDIGEVLGASCRTTAEEGLPSVAVDHLLATAVLPLNEAMSVLFAAPLVSALRAQARKSWSRALGRPLKSEKSFPVLVDQKSRPTT